MHYRTKVDPRERIEELRRLRGFRSTRALALAAGLEQPTLHRYLRRKTEDMTLSHFVALAGALDVTLSELLGEVPLTPRLVLREASKVFQSLDDTEAQQALRVVKAMFPPRADPESR